MTTLATNSSVSLTIGDNGYVNVSTNGGLASVVATPTGASAETTTIGPGPFRRKFGPYAEGASLTLNNATCADFIYDEFDPGNGGGTFSGAASDVTIADAGGYFIGSEVETALQEVGSDVATLEALAPTTGNLAQFGAVRALADWNKYSVTADGVVINGPCIVKGFRCLTGTSIVGVYDALSATGTNLMPSVTTAANTEYLLAGEGGVLFNTGLYVDWGSGTYIFYALPVEP